MNTPTESKSQARSLTTTSYAILAVLSLRPHSTYDLAKQTGLSLRYLWPRADSNLYAEPKRLVEAGLASAREEWTGSRKRTVYSITDSGLEALREWVGSPSAEPRFESEALLKIFFGEHGTPEQMRVTLDALHATAQIGVEHFQSIADTYDRDGGQYPHRFALSAIVARLLLEQQIALERWARWAKELVEGWDTTETPESAEWGVATMRAAGEPYDGVER